MLNLETLKKLDNELEQLYKSKINLDIQIEKLKENILYEDEYSKLSIIDGFIILNNLISSQNYKVEIKKGEPQKINYAIGGLLIQFIENKISLIEFIHHLSNYNSEEIFLIKTNLKHKDKLINSWLNYISDKVDYSFTRLEELIEQRNNLLNQIDIKQNYRVKETGAKYFFALKNQEDGVKVNIGKQKDAADFYYESDIVNSEKTKEAEIAYSSKTAEFAEGSKWADYSGDSKKAEFAEGSKWADYSGDSKKADWAKYAEHSKEAETSKSSLDSSHSSYSDYSKESDSAKKVDESFLENQIKNYLEKSEEDKFFEKAIQLHLSNKDEIFGDTTNDLLIDEIFGEQEESKKNSESEEEYQEKKEKDFIGNSIKTNFDKVIEESAELLKYNKQLEEEERKKQNEGRKIIIITNTHFVGFVLIISILSIIGGIFYHLMSLN